MNNNINLKRKVTAKQAVKSLNKNGVQITETEAVKVLDLLYFLSGIVVKGLLNKDLANEKSPVSENKLPGKASGKRKVSRKPIASSNNG